MQSKMISTNQNFHSSINIAFDLHDENKIKTFIMTSSACTLIENLFLAVDPSSTSRSKVLIGAYGRGKSHVVLMTLALLSKKSPELFECFVNEADRINPRFASYVKEYVCDSRRLLPVLITGNSSNLSQSFLYSLHIALRSEGLEDLMPRTNTQAVLEMLEVWKKDYPDTFSKFTNKLSVPIDDFVHAIKSYETKAYDEFIELYPMLTSGGVFNSFAGLDVVDVYSKTVKNLRECGYDGVYVVYDEFSKYLETNIADATLNDVKLLQDFAEKCNRSGAEQMHLLLICHKDIANYIDGKLPKERVDGWRGVSGRFEHIEIRNRFAESYELIKSSIIKNNPKWFAFKNKNEDSFRQLEDKLTSSGFVEASHVKLVAEDCYPLHPVSTFLLPRISEKVAQNERTLFTYLTANERNSLVHFISSMNDSVMDFVTPDSLYDYFEPLFRKEVYTSEIHSLYELTSRILAQLDEAKLEQKIVKSLMLIYAIAQFECLAPTIDRVIEIYTSAETSIDEVNQAIDNLVRREAVVYQRRSNGYLRLKESSGVDIDAEIERFLETNRGRLSKASILNEVVSGRAVYPSRHNDENEIVRFFQCHYIDSKDYWSLEEGGLFGLDYADGYLIAIQPDSHEDLLAINDSIVDVSQYHAESVFIVPKTYEEIEEVTLRYKAACSLFDAAGEDTLLADEYDVLKEDCLEVIVSYNASFFQPELSSSSFYYMGESRMIRRKAQLSELLSSICDSTFPKTPIINNESINKNELSSAAIHSRTKILSGLCSAVLEPNLGLQGNGQECSIMRSVFSVTGIIENVDTVPSINLSPSDKNISYLFNVIKDFFYSPDTSKTLGDLYRCVTSPEKGIGLKRGLTILFIAAALREDWNNLLLIRGSQEQRLNAGVLNDIDCRPDEYRIKPVAWTKAKADFVKGIQELFHKHAVANSGQGEFVQAVDSISRWYLALPRFAKTAHRVYEGAFCRESYSNLPEAYVGLLRALKRPDINPRGFLFEELPKLYGQKTANKQLLVYLSETKSYIDNYVIMTTEKISEDLRLFFDPTAHADSSLSSIINDWCEDLGDDLREHVFPGSTNRILDALLAFTSDEEYSLKRLFKATTSLRIEDWDERVVLQFQDKMKQMKEDVEDYAKGQGSHRSSDAVIITYINRDGANESRSFDPVICSSRAKLLKNEIENALDEMGQSIDDSEKRQVLFEVLRGIC